MIGHGGPSPSHAQAACWMRAAACWFVSLALATATAACAEEGGRPPAEPPVLRLRVEWGFGQMRAWQGVISVGGGRISAPQPLGIEADEAGSIWLEDGQLNVRERNPRLYDGVDFDIHAPLDAALVVDLRAEDGAATGRIEIPLAALVHSPQDSPLSSPQNSPLDDRGNRLLVRRAPGDRLRVLLPGTDRLVFGCNEQFDLEVQPHRVDAPRASKLRLLTRLLDPSDGKVLWSQEDERVVDEQGSTEPVALSVALPEFEGVYDLAIEASRRGLPNRFGWKHVVDERRVQLVVLSENPHVPDAGSTPPTDVVVEIDPANPAWWKRIAAIPMLPDLTKGPIGSGDIDVWRRPGKLGSFAQLGPGGREPNIAWEAYPLPIQRPGEVHIIEVEYPSDMPQSLGISLVEPDSAGAVLPWGVDSGVYLPGDSAGDEPRLATHRLICWPRTKTPLLLITNRRDGARALFGKIRVRGPKVNPVVAMVKTARDEDETHSYLPRRFPPGDGSPRRLLAAYYDRPLFPENFSAPDAFDPANRRSFDDWHAFYQGAARLADYLNHIGHNGVMLSVLADGSAIYPSQQIDSTPRYDTGVFFSNGQDPRRKDVLELLFRIFDREGLTLIPAVDFSTPLKSLEALRRAGGEEAQGLELIGADGGPWLEKHSPRHGLAPYYNPLNPRVQEEMLAVIKELAARYAGHHSFGGIAVQLSADGYAQLPGADWGYDDKTLARFQRDTGVELPAGPDRFAERVELLENRDRQAWLRWRAGALSLFYRRLQAELASQKPHARLYLAGARLFDRPELKRELEPVLSRSATKNQDVLLSLGIDPELYRELADVVLLRPQRIAPLDSLSQQAANLEVNLDSNLDRQFAGAAHAGSLFYHEPQEARLESFEAKSPFKGQYARTYAWLAAQLSPSGAENRRRFVHALAALDARAMFDGGRMLPLGQESELDNLIAVYRQLPDAPFETLAASPAAPASEAPPGGEGLSTQPVTIRTLSHSGRTYVYMVNDSPWNATVKVSVDMPDCGVRSLNPARRRTPALEGEGRNRSWTIALEPYDIFGAVFTSPSVKFHQPQISLDERVAAQLMHAIDDLFERATVLKDPPSLDVLTNAGFEQPPEKGVPIRGWEATPESVKFVGGEGHSGRYAAQLSSSAGPATLSSDAFAAPRTGWLSVSVWLRTADAAQQPPLWLLLEGQFAGQSYVRKAAVGQGRKAEPLKSEWSQYVFEFPELPTEGISPLRLRFHLAGPGEVWIDDIQMFDLKKLDVRQSLALAMSIQLAGLKLKNRQYADCRQLLEGYWPRYLMSNVQLTNVASRPPKPRDTQPAAETKQGVIDRLKSWLR